MSGETAAVLRDVRALLAEPTHWTQLAYARLPSNRSCHVLDDDARCWCLTGAVFRVTEFRSRTVPGALGLLRDATEPMLIEQWNDAPERTHTEVLAILDRAITQAEAEVAP